MKPECEIESRYHFSIFQTLSGKLKGAGLQKNISSNLFIGKYQLYLPDREELQQKLKEIRSNEPEK